MDDRVTRALRRAAAGLKIAMIVAIYFSLFVIIILAIVGAARG